MKTTYFAVSSIALAVSTLASAAPVSVSTGGNAATIIKTTPSSKSGSVTVYNGANEASQSKSAFRQSTIDYENAEPMPMPTINFAPTSQLEALQINMSSKESRGKSGFSKGSVGSGQLYIEKINEKKVLLPTTNKAADLIASQAFGTNSIEQPFTTSRVNGIGNETTRSYPFRATGKLFINGGGTCTASLIKRGVLVTAAHCVMELGKKQLFPNWEFIPAYNNGTAPYSKWSANRAVVMTSYFNGTDNCINGIVCENDVAVIILNPKINTATKTYVYAGDSTGWYGYSWNGYGYNSLKQAMISQLGYPGALDKGVLMERTDSQGFVDPNLKNNTIMGSLQTAGSSGGPWLVNLGIAPVLDGISFGSESAQRIVGVTSWGFVNAGSSKKQQGASQFTSNNIVPLVNAACKMAPSACS